jgi:dihydrodipicolinate synthase/N-acetylneuraminate lyase
MSEQPGRRRLDRQTLRGVWCALIVPWTDADEPDAARFEREVRAYGGCGVDGVYTGGTTGEFYAQDDATFAHIAEIACREAHEIGLPVQIGCTALSTRTVRRRIATAIAAGADAVQIALPFWLAMRDDEVMQFVRDLADQAGDVPIVLYLTSRSKRKIEPGLLGEIAASVPTFIGTKDTGCDVAGLRAMLAAAPDLAIFGGDNDFIAKVPAGGTGGYCSVTGLNARRVAEYYEHCAAGRLDAARALHREMDALMALYGHWAKEDGLMDSAIDRIQRVAGGVDVGLRCQAPYRSGNQRHVQELLELCRTTASSFLPTEVRPRVY